MRNSLNLETSRAFCSLHEPRPRPDQRSLPQASDTALGLPVRVEPQKAWPSSRNFRPTNPPAGLTTGLETAQGRGASPAAGCVGVEMGGRRVAGGGATMPVHSLPVSSGSELGGTHQPGRPASLRPVGSGKTRRKPSAPGHQAGDFRAKVSRRNSDFRPTGPESDLRHHRIAGHVWSVEAHEIDGAARSGWENVNSARRSRPDPFAR